jgi:diguanylate cyclase (GGDEF)-like protein/PAS domain S-box-containing protein
MPALPPGSPTVTWTLIGVVTAAATLVHLGLQHEGLLDTATAASGSWLDPAGHAWYPAAALTVALVVLAGPRALVVPMVLLPATELQTPGAPAVWFIVALTVLHTAAYGGAGLWLRARDVDLRDAGMADLLRTFFSAAFAAPVVVGFGAALLAHLEHSGTFAAYCRDALAWTTRDMVAVLVAVSLPFAVAGAWQDRRPLRRVTVLRSDNADRALLGLQLLLVAAGVGIGFRLGDADSHPLYLASPALLWLAATRGHRYAAIGVSIFGVGLAIANLTEPAAADLANLRLQIAGISMLTLAVGAQVDDRRRSVLVHQRMTRALEMSEARYRTVLENAADGLLVVEADGTVDIANAAVERITGSTRDEIEGASLLELFPVPDGIGPEQHLDSLLTATTPGASSGGRYLAGRRADGTSFSAHLSVSKVEHHGHVAYTLLLRDESDRKVFEEQLAHRATHDALTDLPNRVLFQDRLQSGIDRLRRSPGALAVLLLDLDRFKPINDQLGHAAGDRVLQEAAARLRAAVRRSDTVARLGGDEFAVLCETASERNDVAATAQRILDELARPYEGVPAALSPSGSIGIRIVRDPHALPHDVVREADAALYRAKHEGRACYRFFDPGGADEARPIDLRARIGAGDVVVHYQPVLDTQEGRCVSVEALVRLRDADGTLVEPAAFVADAERSGLIGRLGELVLRRACHDVATLRRRTPDLRVSVNVSPRQLAERSFVATVADALREAGLPAAALTVEITETTALSQVPAAPAVVGALADLGVQISLDDFGTGSSSLELLRDLPVDEIKLDRSFVRRVCEAGAERDIVAALVGLAERRGIGVVAEGVETIDQADELNRLGCRRLQGFLFGEAVSVGELDDLLVRRVLPGVR